MRRVVPGPLVRAEPLRGEGLDRHGEGRLRPVLDVRREGRRRLDGRVGHVLLGRGERQAGAAGAVERRPRASLSHAFDDDLVCASRGRRPRRSCAASSRSRRTRSSRTTRATSRAGSSSATRSTSSPPPQRSRAADGRRAARDVLAARCRATRSATCRCAPTTASRPSSTSSRPSGSRPTRTAAASFQVVVNGVTGTDRGRPALELGQDRAARRAGPGRARRPQQVGLSGGPGERAARAEAPVIAPGGSASARERRGRPDEAARGHVPVPRRLVLERGERRLDLAPRALHSSSGSAGSTGLFGSVGLLAAGRRARRLLQVEHRQRRAAVRAGRPAGEVDRCAAVRAVDGVHAPAQLARPAPATAGGGSPSRAGSRRR